MKHGELSNEVGYSFGFRCEDFLIHFKDATIVDKALNALFDKARRAEVNEEVTSIMEYLYRNTEYTVDVVVDRENYTPAMKELLDSLPFNRVVLVDKPSQITSRLMMGDLTYYVDDNEERRSLVNSPHTRSLQGLMQEIKRKRRE